jgi:hypothetical protein
VPFGFVLVRVREIHFDINSPKALPAAGEARCRRRYFQRGLIENPIASWVFSAIGENTRHPARPASPQKRGVDRGGLDFQFRLITSNWRVASVGPHGDVQGLVRDLLCYPCCLSGILPICVISAIIILNRQHLHFKPSPR